MAAAVGRSLEAELQRESGRRRAMLLAFFSFFCVDRFWVNWCISIGN